MTHIKPFFIEHAESGIVLAAVDHGQFKSFILREPGAMFTGFQEVEVPSFAAVDQAAHIYIAHTEWDHEYKFYTKDISLLPRALELIPSCWSPRIVISGVALTTLLEKVKT